VQLYLLYANSDIPVVQTLVTDLFQTHYSSTLSRTYSITHVTKVKQIEGIPGPCFAPLIYEKASGSSVRSSSTAGSAKVSLYLLRYWFIADNAGHSHLVIVLELLLRYMPDWVGTKFRMLRIIDLRSLGWN